MQYDAYHGGTAQRTILKMNLEGLLEWQKRPAEQLVEILRCNGSALDGSSLGIGKTFTAGAVIRHLNLPTLVICPAIATTAWKKMGTLLKTDFDVISHELARTGNTLFGAWEHPKVPTKVLECLLCQCEVASENPARCTAHYKGIHCVVSKTKPHTYGKFKWSAGIKLLVVDEVHRMSAMKSLNSDMLVAAKRQGIPVLALSATVATSPLNFKALGYVLGLHSYADFYKWALLFGCRRDGLRGFVFAGNEQSRRARMARLHEDIFPARGVRVRIEDLGDAFPESQVTAELLDLDKNNQIDEAYEEMSEALSELRAKNGSEDSPHPFVRALRAREKIELLKIPLFIDLAEEAIENKHSVAIFVNFKLTLKELARRFNTTCIVDGDHTGPQRQKSIDDFQSNKERIILLNNQAGGVSISLHDEQGGHPRMGIVSLSYSAVITRQVLGRLRRAGGKSKSLYRIPLVAGTVEEKVHRTLVPKLNQLDALQDGDLSPINLPLTNMNFESTLN